MARKLPKPLGQWLDDRGIPRERVAMITTHVGDLQFHLNSDEVNAYGPGDFCAVQLEHDDWPGWSFGLDLAASGGVLAVRIESTVEGRRSGERLTARRLRELPLADLALAARAAVALDGEGTVFEEEMTGNLRRRESGTAPLTDAQLASAMRVYVDAVADGFTTAEAARRFYVSEATMVDYRNRARRRGLFQSLGRGRPGGQLTSKGWAALKEAGE
jgi:hypothetical protein